MWNELTNPVCVFYKRILADERMQMRHINMLALLPSHFIFFPLIKKDISYVTSPLCSYQHTHAREFEGGVKAAMHCTRSHTPAHNSFDYRQQFNMRMPSKRHGECVATHPVLSNDCLQKSRQQLSLLTSSLFLLQNTQCTECTKENNSAQWYNAFRRSRLRIVTLTRWIKERLGATLTLPWLCSLCRLHCEQHIHCVALHFCRIFVPLF